MELPYAWEQGEGSWYPSSLLSFPLHDGQSNQGKRIWENNSELKESKDPKMCSSFLL